MAQVALLNDTHYKKRPVLRSFSEDGQAPYGYASASREEYYYSLDLSAD